MRTHSVLLLAALAMAAGVACAQDANKTYSEGGIFMAIHGRSGKMTFGRRDPPAMDPNKVTVLMDAMRELDANFNVIGTKGKAKHSFNNFARIGFNISSLQDSMLFGNLSAKMAEFKAVVLEQAVVKVETYILKQRGNITLGEEVSMLSRGNLKFNFHITQWPFCNNSITDTNNVHFCRKTGNTRDPSGAYLDFDLTLKGKNPRPEAVPDSRRLMGGNGQRKPKRPKKFKLGGAADLDLSNMVRVDGVWTAMPDGFPRMTTQGSKTIFTLRFPAGDDILYDPTVMFFTEPPTDPDSAAGTMFNSPLALLAVAVVVAMQVLMTRMQL